MAFELKTEITIDATPEKIWSILSDFDEYPNWNPFITSITGDVKVGNKIAVRIEPPGANANNFKPTVTALEPNKKLSWLGVFMFRGVFDGEHQFELIDNKNGTTTLIQQENFIGLLVPLFKKMLDNNTRKGFEAMNKKLKELAEK
ncbi:SRPBCC family protein [Flavobacterium sp. 3HN19-14]|uniref:SRPBCC family protein n=1 Tax=Flavobacterium sp. 3HN19-14 TaxID=3448133 RepID=UPI003EE22BAD